jgi:hypothetical protein
MTNWNFHKGQPLLIELEHSSYLGDFFSKSSDNLRIELTNVCRSNGGLKIAGRQIYYKSEIKSVTTVGEQLEPAPDQDNTEEKDSEPILGKSILTAVQVITENYQYIYKPNAQYHQAITDLQTHEYIGLSCEGNSTGRFRKSSLLAVATSQNIYLFDILKFGGLPIELKNLLENQQPRKIVHHGRRMIERLRRHHCCQTTSVFDTFVEHCAISNTTESISIEKCVNHYFKITLTEDVLLNHPITEEEKFIAGKHAVFLIKLHDFLVHDVLLKKFMTNTSAYVYHLSNNEDRTEVGGALLMVRNPDISLIEDFQLNVNKY